MNLGFYNGYSNNGTNTDYNKALYRQIKLEGNRNQLQRNIKIKDKYLELICQLGFDYDGCDTIENLKGLIDELVRYAELAMECNTTEPMYENSQGKYNILNEKI